jgi:HlyD family secretion protein
VEAPAAGRVSFVSPRAEYTPPVIYSRESRGKLVFMVEAVFAPEVAARLHPGQPVDVRFGP